MQLEIPGEPARHFDAVSGRAHRQNANRDQMGSKAPLPTGRYTIGPVEPLAKGAYPELGPVWIGIESTLDRPNIDPGSTLKSVISDDL